MRKAASVSLFAICAFALFAVSASADAFTIVPLSSSPQGVVIVTFFSFVKKALLQLFSYYLAMFSHLGPVAHYAIVPVSALLLFIAVFGYRFYRFCSMVVGGIVGYAIGYAIYDFLLAWVNHPDWISSAQNVLRWVVVGICAVIGILLGLFLRRLGFSLLLAGVVTFRFTSYTNNLVVLLGILGIVFLIALLLNKLVVIHFTSFVGAVYGLRYLIGDGGCFSLGLNTRLDVTGIDLVLALGILLAFLCVAFQLRCNRGRRC